MDQILIVWWVGKNQNKCYIDLVAGKCGNLHYGFNKIHQESNAPLQRYAHKRSTCHSAVYSSMPQSSQFKSNLISTPKSLQVCFLSFSSHNLHFLFMPITSQILHLEIALRAFSNSCEITDLLKINTKWINQVERTTPIIAPSHQDNKKSKFSADNDQIQ